MSARRIQRVSSNAEASPKIMAVVLRNRVRGRRLSSQLVYLQASVSGRVHPAGNAGPWRAGPDSDDRRRSRPSRLRLGAGRTMRRPARPDRGRALSVNSRITGKPNILGSWPACARISTICSPASASHPWRAEAGEDRQSHRKTTSRGPLQIPAYGTLTGPYLHESHPLRHFHPPQQMSGNQHPFLPDS